MSSHRLAAHPTPGASQFDFSFSSSDEMKRYTEFETKYTVAERSAYGAAMTTKERKEAAEVLEKKRRAVYKMWKSEGQLNSGDDVA